MPGAQERQLAGRASSKGSLMFSGSHAGQREPSRNTWPWAKFNLILKFCDYFPSSVTGTREETPRDLTLRVTITTALGPGGALKRERKTPFKSSVREQEAEGPTPPGRHGRKAEPLQWLLGGPSAGQEGSLLPFVAELHSWD